MISRARILLVVGGLLGVTTTATSVALRLTAGLRRPADPDYSALLVAGAAWVLVVCVAWACLVSAALLLEVVSSGRLHIATHLGCPPSLRRAVLGGLGIALTTGGAAVAMPASAVPAPAEGSGAGRFSVPVPARPTDARSTGAAYDVPRQRVQVEPGDSLWRIAERRPGQRASSQEVARLVERTYRANRRVIGPDPDLIFPGQRLEVPGVPHQRPHTPPHSETP
jgi:LysM repeat protein